MFLSADVLHYAVCSCSGPTSCALLYCDCVTFKMVVCSLPGQYYAVSMSQYYAVSVVESVFAIRAAQLVLRSQHCAIV